MWTDVITQKSQNAFNARPAKSYPLGNGARTGNRKQEVWTLLRDVCMLHNGRFVHWRFLLRFQVRFCSVNYWQFRDDSLHG